MTTEQLANMLAEINRAAMSGQLEYLNNDGQWVTEWSFVSNIGNYRIKPKPREVWVKFKGEGYGGFGAEVFFHDWGNGAVHFREVCE